ncbi:MAG: AAA family ATPase, partial [Dehalococcoidales bacterium]|nr:AAA family ATPase [Dehalococcoidales bacterium]
MYLKHFGFKSAPFERDLPAEHLYNSPYFAEGLARLIHACEKRTLALITGEAGSGKSALLRLLGNKLDPNTYLYNYIADSNLTPRNFYHLSLGAMGLTPPGHLPKLKSMFKKAMLDLFENKGKTTVIAIDEGQTLEVPMLLELRFIMNFRYDSFSPLAVILVGESSLRAMLRAYHMSAIWRRVEIGYHLGTMDFEQTKLYINHQLK